MDGAVGRAMSYSRILSEIFYLSPYVFLRFFIRPHPHSYGGSRVV